LPPLFRKSGRKTVTVAYIKKALAKSQPIFKMKSPILSLHDWFLYRDDAAVHTAASIQDFKWQRGIKTICHPPYLSATAPAVLFLCRIVKTGLAGIL
jgi:hypothetical protein